MPDNHDCFCSSGLAVVTIRYTVTLLLAALCCALQVRAIVHLRLP